MRMEPLFCYLSYPINYLFTEDTLTVEDLTESDTGFYSCRADNGREVVTVGTSIRVSPPREFNQK